MTKLGQHFLTNKQALKKIAGFLDLKKDDTVIEIGPGHGELTQEIRIRNSEVGIIAIERDGQLADALRVKFSGDEKIEIITGDALKILPSVVRGLSSAARGYKMAGNIPYYITGKFLRTIGELAEKPALSVFTIQKEVAERLAAKPPKMNRLAASVQFWAKPEIALILPRTDFHPAPEVDSATIILKMIPARGTDTAYYKTMRAVFSQPRKTILNNLSASLEIPKKEISEKLKEAGIGENLRPQNLSVEDILKLAGIF